MQVEARDILPEHREYPDAVTDTELTVVLLHAEPPCAARVSDCGQVAPTPKPEMRNHPPVHRVHAAVTATAEQGGSLTRAVHFDIRTPPPPAPSAAAPAPATW